MSHTGELLVEVQEQVDHLLDVRTDVTGPDSLRQDVSLRNDLLFGLLNLSRAVGELAAEVSDRRDLQYEDAPDALRRIGRLDSVPDHLADRLRPFARLAEEIDGRPSTTDYEPVIAALYELEPVKTFASFAAGIDPEAGPTPPGRTHDRIAPRPGVEPGDLLDGEGTSSTGPEPNGG